MGMGIKLDLPEKSRVRVKGNSLKPLANLAAATPLPEQPDPHTCCTATAHGCGRPLLSCELYEGSPIIPQRHNYLGGGSVG